MRSSYLAVNLFCVVKGILLNKADNRNYKKPPAFLLGVRYNTISLYVCRRCPYLRLYLDKRLKCFSNITAKSDQV